MAARPAQDPAPAAARDRLAALRAVLRTDGLDGVIVPLTDEHFSEYVGAYAKRLEWLTGFTGSAGAAIVLADRAALFVDGRYTLQVRQQVEAGLYSFETVPDTSLAEWLAAQAGPGAGGQALRVGYDPWLHAEAWLKAARPRLERAGITLVPLAINPVDRIWPDRPSPSLAPVEPHLEIYTGRSSAGKRTAVAETIRKAGADAAVISALDSIAWLFNIRGRDVEHTPVARAFALLDAAGEARLFIEPEKLPPETRTALAGVALLPRAAFAEALADLGRAGRRIMIDPDTTVSAIARTIADAGGTLVEARDPCALPKARKTPAEVDGCRAAHVRDGLAVARFLHWLDQAMARGGVDELGCVDQLLAFRCEHALFRGPSFDTIAGSGPNGAIVHYRSTPASNRRLAPGELFLLDSGGQYLDGTTDITRTVAIGPAGPEERDRFSRVLKGHIALAACRFPKGTSGRQLDTLARLHLWQAGLDFDHGTGHGVGAYLGVHEGPQRIAKAGPDVALEPGMLISNEPGYYKTGAYGIRIENLVLVEDRPAPGDERAMLGFETVTLVPIDLGLVEPRLLDEAERAWLNAYHARVRATLAPLADTDVRAWIERATRPI